MYPKKLAEFAPGGANSANFFFGYTKSICTDFYDTVYLSSYVVQLAVTPLVRLDLNLSLLSPHTYAPWRKGNLFMALPSSSFTAQRRFWSSKLGRLAALLLILSLLIGPSGLVVSAQDAPVGQASADAWAKMSTPQRINSAFARRQIDASTRLLYLTYAVYDNKSLPAAYQGAVGWYGTETVREVQEAYSNSSKLRSFPSAMRREMDRLLGPTATAVATVCGKEDLNTTDTTSSTYFAINYDDAGGANPIAGGLNLGQYAASLDAAYAALVIDYGWAQPPLCGEDGVDCGGPVTPGGKFPVQVTDLGTGLYGYVTTNGGLYAGYVIGDNPHTALVETDSLSSCMVLNSDYSQIEGNTPIASLNATTAHEYVHAIQNAWGEPGAQMLSMWAESTAAYFEDEVDDASNTQYEYLFGLYNDNNLNEWASGDSNEYSNFLFFRYVAEQYGGANSKTGGEKVIQKFFENVATSTPAADKELLSFKAAVESFALGGGAGTSNFKDVFHNYAIALKFLKDCQDQTGYVGPYCWEEGTEYRAKATAGNNEGDPGAATSVPLISATIATATGNHTGNIKSDYGTQWVRLPADGSNNYRVDLSSSSATQLRASVVCDTGTAFVINPLPQLVVGATPQSVANYDPTGCADVVLVITNQKETVTVRAASGVDGPSSATVTDAYTVQLGEAVKVVFDKFIYLPLLLK